jgi:hypothetical protein
MSLNSRYLKNLFPENELKSVLTKETQQILSLIPIKHGSKKLLMINFPLLT